MLICSCEKANEILAKNSTMFTSEIENDRRTVETWLFFNVNFYSEIRVEKFAE